MYIYRINSCIGFIDVWNLLMFGIEACLGSINQCYMIIG